MLPPDLAVNRETALDEPDEPMPVDLQDDPCEDPQSQLVSFIKLNRPKTASRKSDIGVSASFEEEKKGDDVEVWKNEDDDLSVIEEEVSDDDNFS